LSSKEISFQWEASAAIRSVSEVVQLNHKNRKAIFN